LSGDERHDLLLAACEAASNGIEHARDPSEPFVDVLTEIGGAYVTIVVRDYGQWRLSAPGAHRGHGLGMMWALTETTIDTGPLGTTVTIRSGPQNRRYAVAPSVAEAGAAYVSRRSSRGLGGPCVLPAPATPWGKPTE
jgi:hypothetical protein